MKKPGTESFTARIFGIIAAVTAVSAFTMAISVPYRIHQGIYTWYLWTERLRPLTSLIALVSIMVALIFGLNSRQRLAIVLAVVSGVLLIFSMSFGIVHSGPNPQAWCYNNLRRIEAAKFQLSSENHLTNGAVITGAQISKYVDGGFAALTCAEKGKYSLGAIGTESRCSVHGTISEMERGWQKEMHRGVSP